MTRSWEGYCRGQEEQAEYQAMLETLAELYSCDPLEDHIKRQVYKYTRCGAWISFPQDKPLRVLVGSIVEGVVGDPVEPITVTYDEQFLIRFEDALEAIEDRVDEVWNETHGCPDCFGNEDGGPVNPDCKSCSGAGMII